MLKGKTVLVTGTNRGIGKAIIEEFAKKGANIFAHARRETSMFLDSLKEMAEKYDVDIKPVFFDMTDKQAMKEIIGRLINTKTHIDVLVNNAGIISKGIFSMTPVDRIREVFEINFFSHLELTQLILKAMYRQKEGNIVNIGSIGGLDAGRGNTAYAASKAALMAWTKTLAAEFGPAGIRVNAIAPFLTSTDMADQITKTDQEVMIEHISLKRAARPEEIAKVVSFLASDESSFINGQIVRVDGGVVL